MKTKLKYVMTFVIIAVCIITVVVISKLNSGEEASTSSEAEVSIPLAGVAQCESMLTEIYPSGDELMASAVEENEQPVLTATEEVQETSQYDSLFMVITTEGEYVNIRASADENSEIIGKAYAYTGGTVLEKGDTWTYISSGNATGYIKNDFLIFGDDVAQVASERCMFTATVSDNELRIRREANLDCETWGLAAVGEVYNVTSLAYDGFVEVDVNGYPGYLSSEYVTLNINLGTAITAEEEAAAAAAAAAAEAAAAEAAAAEAAAFDNAIQYAIDTGVTSDILSTSIYAVSDRDAYLLACLVQAEAGYESYEGKRAVANVVVTRYFGGSYGSTIETVIYASGQFSVVSQGYFDQVVKNGPGAEAIQAAKEALAGVDNRMYTNFCSGSYYTNNSISYSRGEIIGSQFFYNR